MMNSVSSGSYISEIAKFDATLHDCRSGRSTRFHRTAISIIFLSPRNGLRSRRRRDIRSVGRCRTDHADVARIKTGNDLSCASSRRARAGTDISPDSVNFSSVLKVSCLLCDPEKFGNRDDQDRPTG